jgi:very-short-patch-repair endonuclease
VKKLPEKTKTQLLRQNQTAAEKLLWRHLRNRNFLNQKFRRQHPIGKYIVDFCCLEKRLIIEVDGGQHNDEGQIRYDNTRTEYLESHGFIVLRFWNNQILGQTEHVLNEIVSVLERPHPRPLPQGEGK